MNSLGTLYIKLHILTNGRSKLVNLLTVYTLTKEAAVKEVQTFKDTNCINADLHCYWQPDTQSI